MPSPSEITLLVDAAAAGDTSAAEELLPLVYDELRELASQRLRKLAPGQTLQPTALVHEAYLRVVGQDDPGWENRGHFFFAAARAMKQILVEQARRKASLKRGGDRKQAGRRSTRCSALPRSTTPVEDMLALDERHGVSWRTRRPRLHELVLLRFFAGLSIPQTAEAMGVSERTVEREWKLARVRIFEKLNEIRGPSVMSDAGRRDRRDLSRPRSTSRAIVAGSVSRRRMRRR